MKDLLKALERVPLRFREGPWSPVAWMYLLSFFSFLVYSYPTAMASMKDIHEEDSRQNTTLFAFRVFSALWGVFILITLLINTGLWPLISYTLTTWNLLWLRMVFASLSSVASLSNTNTRFIARALKFPSLVGCTTTVTIWWTVLVPLIHYLMGEKQKQLEFWNFNTSFLLLNIHLVNLPLAGIEFYLSSSKLVFFDLWVSLLVAFVYIIFYLGILDARGIHLYIILTPRTHWCFASYSLVLCIYYSCFVGWNQAFL
jgi:hypothetical protein